MAKSTADARREALEIARQQLEKEDVSHAQREQLLSLLDLLIKGLGTAVDVSEHDNAAMNLAEKLVDQRGLLFLLQQKTAELDAIKRISLSLTSTLEPEKVLASVVQEAMQLLENARDAHIFLYQNDKLSFGAALDSEGKTDEIFAEPREDGLTYTVARKREIIIVEDMKNHPLFEDVPDDWVGSIIGIPLMIGTRVLGVMNVAREKVGGFSESDIHLLTLLADQAAIAIVNARLHRATSQQARSDTLTGLPNRRALDEKLEQEVKYAETNNSQLTVVMMDLDGFKAINDTFGHHAGDQVLREAFVPLVKNLRDSDFLARYGGDELTLVLRETGLEAARVVAQKVQEKLRSALISLPDNTQAILDLSGGIAVFPIHGLTASELLRAADQALYRAKQTCRGNFLSAVRLDGSSE